MSLVDLNYNFNIFETFALNAIKNGPIPKHIAVIMDGNRRFAKQNKLLTKEGHTFGFKKLCKFLAWSMALGIEEITVFAFSVDNFNRSEEEVEGLMKFCHKVMKHSNDFLKAGVSLRFVGDSDLLSLDLKETIQEAVKLTSNCKNIILNIAFAYSSRNEMANSVNFFLWNDSEKIDENSIQEKLYLKSKPNLVLRSSGESRLSDFLMLQNSEAILFFKKKLWPELGFFDLVGVIFLYQMCFL